jgi:hypothetical protein
MAVCLEYQAVYVRRKRVAVVTWRLYASVCLIVVCSLALKVRGQLSITTLGYELHAAQAASKELSRQQNDLDYQLSVISTHEHLRHEGSTRLKLRETALTQVRHVSPSPF